MTSSRPESTTAPGGPTIMSRWIALEAEARDLARRVECDPAHDATARRLLGLLYAGRQLVGEALR